MPGITIRNMIGKGIEEIRAAGEEQKTNRRTEDLWEAGEEQNRNNHITAAEEERKNPISHWITPRRKKPIDQEEFSKEKSKKARN